MGESNRDRSPGLAPISVSRAEFFYFREFFYIIAPEAIAVAQTSDLRKRPAAGRMTDLVGKPASLIPTPALVVETEALERNLGLMSDFFARRHAKLRPHFKSHKCVTIARRQLERGNAVGITCAKLSEAEVLAAGGIPDILIANQIVGRDKLERVAELARRCRLAVAVDDESQVRQLLASRSESSAAAERGPMI
jgi:D-serine deaminase-like pyridoxal phosphate-dependent protein